MATTRELLAEYVALLNKHGTASHEEMRFAADHADNTEFTSLAKTARKIKEYFDNGVCWLTGQQRMEQRVGALEQRAATGELIAGLVEADPHQWSTRPCQTCRAVSLLLGRPFGCEAKAGRCVV